MGLLVDTCLNCRKKDDEDEFSHKKENKVEIGDKYCKGTIIINDLTKSTKKSIMSSILFNNLFYKDPFKYYTINSELSDNSKLVTFIKNPKVYRLMKIIVRNDIMDNEERK